MKNAHCFRALAIAVTVAVFILLATDRLIAGQTVLAEIFELPDGQTWPTVDDEPSERFDVDVMALPILPRRYSADGLIVDRKTPFVLRLSMTAELPPAEYDFLLRAMNKSRLLIDGRQLAETEFTIKFNDGHNEVPELTQAIPDLRMLAPGHAEQIVSFRAGETPHHFVVEAVIGGKQKRPETGELCLCIREIGESQNPYVLMGTAKSRSHDGSEMPLTDLAWGQFVKSESIRVLEQNRLRRNQADQQKDYWAARHQQAGQHVSSLAPIAIPASDAEGTGSVIDRFVLATIDEGELPALIDDFRFLRRLALDTVGAVPTLDEIEAYRADPARDRRAAAIDRYLADDRWADHWVSYWQDVLAENPGILKPKLNNTGPFRWWIHESFLDNKSIDRFVTELMMMRGSVYAGGPAGFSMATQNDVPMAAKAHVLGQAFLGIQMKCAGRCHDSPQHDLRQEQLFQLAAMLNRKPQKVPESSSIPAEEVDLGSLLVEVSLAPGSEVTPMWPFASIANIGTASSDGIIQNENDTRERLAAIVTSYTNERFAQVIVNRLWHRYMGRGIVDSVDDWEHATTHSPALLDYLARQLIGNRYDLKHVAGLILNSRTYQSEVTASEEDSRLLPIRRRKSAEQLVDSLFTISGKAFKSEALNLDVDGQRPVTSFLNLGAPYRTGSSPRCQTSEIVRHSRCLEPRVSSTFLPHSDGASRQDPITSRDTQPTVQQPGLLANGVVAQRTTCLSDDNSLTGLCHSASSPDQLAEQLFLQILSRLPTSSEKDEVSSLLRDGFASRVVQTERRVLSTRRHAVSWSNHLNKEATRLKLEEERQVRKGDPPTLTLAGDWRERAEDVVWALINSPEFVFVP